MINSNSNIRNGQYNADGTIDLEVDVSGNWIPFTASNADSEQHGVDLHARAIAELTIAPAATPAIEVVRENTIVARVDIVEAMIAADPTKTVELEAWALENKIPTSAAAIFAALPLRERMAALRNESLQRSSPLVTAFGSVYGYDTEAKLDALFGI